ncbi:MAG: HAD family hydrolase [Spirochaetota bacterium]
MKVFTLPPEPLGLVFDLDSTLYTHEAYARFQTEVLVRRLARERGEAEERVAALVKEVRDRRRRETGAETSLGRVFVELGVPIETSVRWREELIVPADWLEADPRLHDVLAALGERYAIALLTNNPRSVGEASLAALGLRDLFGQVVGLDDSLCSKPDPAPFRLVFSRLGLDASNCVSIGDRMDVDIEPALALGAGGILVEGVLEVYKLLDFLGKGLDRRYSQ